MTAQQFADGLTKEGFSLRTEAGKLLVAPYSRLSDQQRLEIAGHKDALIKLLSSRPRWVEDEAQAIVEILLHKKAQSGRVGEVGCDARFSSLMDAVDAAVLARDMGALRESFNEFVIFIDTTYPRRIGATVLCEPPQPGTQLYTGWVRVGRGTWLAAIHGVDGRWRCEELLSGYPVMAQFVERVVMESEANPKGGPTNARAGEVSHL